LKFYSFYSFLLGIILIPILSFAQSSSKIDSLLNQLKVGNGNSKIDILNALSLEVLDLNPQKSIEYAEQARKLAEQVKYNKGLAESNKNLGIANKNLKSFDNALKFLFTALAIQEGLNDNQNRAETLRHIGDAYRGKQVYTQALSYYIKSVEVFEKLLGNKKGTLTVLNSIANTYLAVSEYKNSMAFAKKSMMIAQEIDAKEELTEAYHVLAEVYAALENYQKAFEYHKIYTILQDSLQKVQKTNEITRLEKENEYQIKKIEKDRREAESKIRATYYQYIVIVLMFLSIILVVLFIKASPISVSILENLVFVGLFLFAQFGLLLLIPTLERITGNLPLFMLLLNGGLVYLFVSMQKYLERYFNRRLKETKN